MMRFTLTMIAAAIGLAAATVAAGAGEAFQMTGTWKGDAIVVFSGANPYRPSTGKGANFPEDTIVFTFEIEKQVGNRFSGKSSGGPLGETIVGAVSPDNQRGIMLDDDGQYDFTVVDPTTLNVCYHHSYPTGRVVGCYQLKKQ